MSHTSASNNIIFTTDQLDTNILLDLYKAISQIDRGEDARFITPRKNK